MKIDKELKNTELKILDQKFGFSNGGSPQISFKLNFEKEPYDPFWQSLSLSDKAFKFTLHQIHLMTGWAGESLLDLDPDSRTYYDCVGKKFISDIEINEYEGKKYPRVRFPKNDKMSLEKLKELDNKYKADLVAHAAEHKSTNDIDIDL